MFKSILTQEELLSMPESAYMNEAQLDFFERHINDEIKGCYKRVSALTKELHDLKYNGQVEIIDQAYTMAEISLKAKELTNYNVRLKALENALTHIKDGSYGYCDYSGDEIGLKRLLINPATILSFEEQEKREKLSKHYG